MRDDLNTPEVVATLFETTNRAAHEISARPAAAGEFASLAGTVEEVMTVFGFDLTRELTTDVNGVASPTSWQLGTLAGNYTLTASSGTLTPIVFTSTARANSASGEKPNRQSTAAAMKVAAPSSSTALTICTQVVAIIPPNRT